MIKVQRNLRIEHHINPPMPQVITLPLEVDGISFVMYLSYSAFQNHPTTKQLTDAVNLISDKLES